MPSQGAYPIQSLANGGIKWSDGSITGGQSTAPKPAAYPIASMADGRVKYSDGSIRGTANQSSYENKALQSPAPENMNPAQQNDWARSQGFDGWDHYRDSLSRGESQGAPNRTPLSRPTQLSSLNTSLLSSNNSGYSSLIKPPTESGGNFLSPGSDFRQGLGNFVDAASKFGFEQTLGKVFGKTDAYGNKTSDVGFSELIAGAPTTKTYAYGGLGYGSNQSIDKPSNVAQDSSFAQENQSRAKNSSKTGATPIATMADGSILYSDGSKSGGRSNDILDRAKTTASGFDANPVSDNSAAYNDNSIFAVVDDAYNEANRLYMEGAISEEEAQKRIADAQKQALLARYGKIKADAEALIPQYQRFEEEAVTGIDQGLNEIKSTGAETKADTQNRYGDLIRRSVKNKQLLDAQRRNMFSALGTAESSAFIENQTSADKQFGTDLTGTEQEMGKRVGDIDKEILKAETTAKAQIASIKADTQDKIMAVQRNINASDQEKAAQIQALEADLYANLTSIQQDFNNKRAALIETQVGQANNLSTIRAQAGVDENLLRLQYGLQSQAAGLQKSIPPELEQPLKGFARAPQSSVKANKDRELLKSKYPQWADLIDGVYTGKISAQELESVIAGGGATSPTSSSFSSMIAPNSYSSTAYGY